MHLNYVVFPNSTDIFSYTFLTMSFPVFQITKMIPLHSFTLKDNPAPFHFYCLLYVQHNTLLDC